MVEHTDTEREAAAISFIHGSKTYTQIQRWIIKLLRADSAGATELSECFVPRAAVPTGGERAGGGHRETTPTCET